MVQDGGRQENLARKSARARTLEGVVSASTAEKPKRRKTTRWQRPREEGARVQVLSSFAKPDKTNEQTEVRIVVPAEVPRDARISIEDLADVDESDIEIDQSKDNEKKVKQPGARTQEPVKQPARGWDPKTLERKEQCQLQAVPCESDAKRDELHRALKSALETQVIVCSDAWLSAFSDYVGSGMRPTTKYAKRRG